MTTRFVPLLADCCSVWQLVCGTMHHENIDFGLSYSYVFTLFYQEPAGLNVQTAVIEYYTVPFV